MKHPSFQLDQLQRWMQSVITHHAGIEPGIESDEAQCEIDVSVQNVEEVIGRSKAMDSVERLAIYGNAYYARLLQCLRDSFPALVETLGEEIFDEFAVGYLQNYPSTSYTLARLGDHFMQYLEETRPDAEAAQRGEIGWPDFLIDLATLEWNIEQVFDGPGVEETPLLDDEAIGAIAPDQWPEARLQTAPCLRLLAFRFPVNTHFTEFRAETHPPMPAPGEQFVAIYRRDYVVRRLELTRLQYELLRRLSEQETVGESLNQVTAMAGDDVDHFASQLMQWFSMWSQAGFFLSVDLPDA